MFKYIDRVLFIVNVLCSSHMHGILSTQESLPWPNADEIVQAVCPYTKICDVRPAKTGPYDSCCTECFCGEECNSNPECCFHKNTKKSYETCLYLRSKSNNRFAFTPKDISVKSYYVVTSRPIDGCLENKGSCDSAYTPALYPVFSPKTGQIYFDQNCATCHGVDDAEQPILYFMCDDDTDNLNSESINFDDELSKFLSGDDSSICYLSFDFNSVDIIKRSCTMHAVDSIEKLINITNENHLNSHYNMTIEYIVDACISSLYAPAISPSKKLYPNPFCYLLGEGTHEKGSCYQSSGGVKFSAIINSNVKDGLRLDARRKVQNLGQLCYKRSTSSNKQQPEKCRPVSCPLGHLIDKNSRCVFFGLRVLKEGRAKTFVNVILTSTDDKSLHGNDLMNITINDIEHSLQLPGKWKLAFWGLSADYARGVSRDKTEIITVIEKRPGDLPEALDSMKLYLKSEVVILNNTYSLKVYGKTISLEKKLPEDILSENQCSTVRNRTGLPHIENDVSDCWKIIAFNSEYRRYSITVEPLSKLYFCNLVQLYVGEYRLMANDTVLFNEIGSLYLHDNEFLVLKNGINEPVVKVCAVDSGLISPVSSAPCTYNGNNIYVFILYIVNHYLAYFKL